MANKKDREIIFNKYDGRCSYCGTKLQKGWHVDELLPIIREKHHKRDADGTPIKDKNNNYVFNIVIKYPERLNIDNQMPSCSSCNINKHSMSLEEFRSLIEGFMKHLNKINTQYKIAKRYGLVTEDIKPVVFYFEREALNAMEEH